MSVFELIDTWDRHTHRVGQIKGERSPCQAKYSGFYEALSQAGMINVSMDVEAVEPGK